jgi:hypothetical protein
VSTTALRHPAILPDDFGQRELAFITGDLVDLTEEATRLRFRHPVACTREVWEDCIEWNDEIEAGKTGYSAQEQQARLRDVLWLALLAAKRSRGSKTYFTVARVARTGPGTRATEVTLTLSIGPGDAGEPVLTIALPPSR